jgi:sulfur carrier protein
LLDSNAVTLIINGEPKQFQVSSLASLIAALGMKSDRVAVELNREIVPRVQWDQTPLNDGDKLEIVHFVGGGKVESGMCNVQSDDPL